MEIKQVTVVGSGLMGSGIAQVIATSGFPVRIFDSFPEALEKGRRGIEKSLSRMLKAGRIKEENVKEIMSRISFHSGMEEAVKGSELIIEAVPEVPELKEKVFQSLEKLSGPEAILATNTSNIRITEIASKLSRPERLVGMHFFNPPVMMKLVEVIKGEKTSETNFQAVFDFSKKIGKDPIKVFKDTAGFVVNRISAPESLYFILLLENKVDTPEAIDAFARSQALPMGPYELMDYVGIDTVLHSLEYYRSTLSEDYGKAEIPGKMVKENRLGIKTGEGFYKWQDGKAQIPKANPSTKVELMDVFALEINEAVKLIEDGVATPVDIEKGFCLGMNRPFGPISVAKGLSNREVKGKLDQLHEKYGVDVFKPARSIEEGKMKEAIDGNLKVPQERRESPVETDGDLLKVVRKGKVVRIQLNNGRNNLLNTKVLDELDHTIDKLWSDREVFVIVIAGNGNVFSAGAELTQFIPDSLEFMEHSRKGERIFRKLSEIPKIVIAEMKGYVLGGGFELSLNCDIRVSHGDCVIGFPETTIGLLPGWSGSQKLAKLIGMSRAAYLILTGERFTGEIAKEYGLVSRLYGKEELETKTMEFAQELSEKVSPIAASLSKKLIYKGSEVPMDIGLEMESIAMGNIYNSKDFMEGISAFVQKRKPEYKFQ
ncbi:MAG: 3-hydroxyacyl-CoA dehydrogenase/enoyl-CoA hydratase family protein [Cuniculiplasma sp.]